MRTATLCIIFALTLGGWHDALSAVLCAHPECAAAAPRRAASHEEHPPAAQADEAPAHETGAKVSGHCGGADERGHDAEVSDENPGAEVSDEKADAGVPGARSASNDSAGALAAPAQSSCAHCVGGSLPAPPAVAESRTLPQARDARAAPPPARGRVELPRAAPLTRPAPAEHSPPPGRALHLLNSVLLI